MKIRYRETTIYACVIATIIIILLALIVTAVGKIAGNQRLFDTVCSYDRAIIRTADGEIVKGTVDDWADYENSDQIQVTIDGVIYLVHSSNLTLIAE